MLRYRWFECEGAKATVVILPGYNENNRKYDELAYDLCRQGFAPFVMDHRGQGFSDRLNAKAPMAFIDRFEYFVDDLATFVETAVPSARPRFLLAHSMGGAIAALYLKLHPHVFQAVALSAPMLEMNLGGRREFLLRLGLFALGLWRGDESYLPGRGPQTLASQTFEANAVTSSRPRFEQATARLRENPALLIGDQSVGWLRRALEGTSDARSSAREARDPILLLQAGADAFVLSPAQNAFCAQAPNCRLFAVPGSRHEILQERDEFRTPALAEIVAFFRGHGPA